MTLYQDRERLGDLIGGDNVLLDALESLTKHGFIKGFSISGELVEIDCDHVHIEDTINDIEWHVQSGRSTKPNDHRYSDPLVQHWYKILRESGFNDIEHRREISSVIKVDDYKQSYYERAATFLHSYDWTSHHYRSNQKHKEIFEKHCEGLSVRSIAKQLSVCPNTVHRVIKTYRELFL